MGGKNAVIVMDDADLDLATDGILWSAFGTSGQRCTAASRVVVHRAVQKELVERLVARAGGMRLGNGLDETIDIGPVVSAGQLDTDQRLRRDRPGAKAPAWPSAATIARDGDLATRPLPPADDLRRRRSPTCASPRRRSSARSPPLIPVDSLDEAIDVVNGVKYGLSASIFTADVNHAFRAMQDIFTGILYVNAGTTGAEIHLPFGGTKATGNGHREAGTAALDFFTEWQSIYVDYSGTPPARPDRQPVAGGQAGRRAGGAWQ